MDTINAQLLLFVIIIIILCLIYSVACICVCILFVPPHYYCLFLLSLLLSLLLALEFCAVLYICVTFGKSNYYYYTCVFYKLFSVLRRKPKSHFQ